LIEKKNKKAKKNKKNKKKVLNEKGKKEQNLALIDLQKSIYTNIYV
jgi:hypothetical protein